MNFGIIAIIRLTLRVELWEYIRVYKSYGLYKIVFEFGFTMLDTLRIKQSKLC